MAKTANPFPVMKRKAFFVKPSFQGLVRLSSFSLMQTEPISYKITNEIDLYQVT